MKIAYLVLAHNNLLHLQRLVSALSTPDSRFYMHVDRKVDEAPFRRLAESGVRFCEERVSCAWGNISLVDATLNLARMALADGDGFDYLVLLSGACYPVQSNDYIEAFFDRHRGTEFIEVCTVPNPVFGKPIERLTRYYIRRNPPLTRLKHRFQSWLHRILPARDYRRPLAGLELVAGSQWWALTPAAVACVLDFVAAHPAVYRFCRHMDCPDEFIFQLALWNSPFRSRISHSLMFVHWQPGKPSPENIDGSYLGALGREVVIASAQNLSPGEKREVLFARKFGDASGDVVSAIDALNRSKHRPRDVLTA